MELKKLIIEAGLLKVESKGASKEQAATSKTAFNRRENALDAKLAGQVGLLPVLETMEAERCAIFCRALMAACSWHIAGIIAYRERLVSTQGNDQHEGQTNADDLRQYHSSDLTEALEAVWVDLYQIEQTATEELGWLSEGLAYAIVPQVEADTGETTYRQLMTLDEVIAECHRLHEQEKEKREQQAKQGAERRAALLRKMKEQAA